jgi:hypothetical protein
MSRGSTKTWRSEDRLRRQYQIFALRSYIVGNLTQPSTYDGVNPLTKNPYPPTVRTSSRFPTYTLARTTISPVVGGQRLAAGCQLPGQQPDSHDDVEPVQSCGVPGAGSLYSPDCQRHRVRSLHGLSHVLHDSESAIPPRFVAGESARRELRESQCVQG